MRRYLLFLCVLVRISFGVRAAGSSKGNVRRSITYCSEDKVKNYLGDVRIYERIFRDLEHIWMYHECLSKSPGSMERYHGKRYYVEKLENLVVSTKSVFAEEVTGYDITMRRGRVYPSISDGLAQKIGELRDKLQKCGKWNDRLYAAQKDGSLDVLIPSRYQYFMMFETPHRESPEVPQIEYIDIDFDPPAETELSCQERVPLSRLINDLKEIRSFPESCDSPASIQRYGGNQEYLTEVQYYFDNSKTRANLSPDDLSKKNSYGFGARIQRFLERLEIRFGRTFKRQF